MFHIRHSVLFASFVAAVLTVCAQEPAPTPQSNRLDEALSRFQRGRSVAQVAVSPDGQRLAWIEEGIVYLVPLSDLNQRRKIASAGQDRSCRASNLIWSPANDALAFLSDCASTSDQADLYLTHLDGKPARRLSALHGLADAPAFSPDGKLIAFLYVDGATRPANSVAAEPPLTGVIGEDHIEIQRVAMVPADASQPAAPTFLTPGHLHAFEFDWSPDSAGLVYIAADPPGENNWWVAKLYTQSLHSLSASTPTQSAGDRQGSQREPKVILDPASVAGPLHGLQIAVPRWSPDGQKIAFIGGLMSDQGVTGGDVWIVPAAGGEPVNVTPGRPTSSGWIEWAGNQEIFSAELAGGNTQLVLLRLHASRGCTFGAGVHGPVFSIPASASDGRSEMSLSSGAGHNLFVFLASSFDRPQEIYAARADNVISACAGSEEGNLAQLTHWNSAIKPAWGKAESLTWTNGGYPVQGWLLYPAHYDPQKKYSLLVEVHGGPAAAAVPRWSAYAGGLGATIFSALDDFVLLPNPRGSYGQGEAFTEANRKDFGYGDLQDILAGVDTVLARFPVDPNRVGILGWSYGGYMSMFAVTQTHRFHAAVAGAGISDWLSYYGENSIDQWMIPYFGATVYDDPSVYARSAPITFIKQVETPTLMVVGDRDGECPAPQSFEFWHALRDRHVPTQLVVYPDEGHGFSDPAHRYDVLQRAVEWFDRYLK